MSDPQTAKIPRVRPDSHLTLHYRIGLADSGTEVISTFDGRPATLQLGLGQLAETLERCLIDLPEGSQRRFELNPGEAYGERNPELIQHLSRSLLEEAGEPGADYAPGDMVQFPAPDGGSFAGVFRQWRGDTAVFDFNHPLAGQRIVFEVRILGIL